MWFPAFALAAVTALAPELPLGHADFVPTPARPVGFRGDWTGRYPGAQPPLEWSFDKNLAWKTPVGEGESSPIVVGDRLFILSNGTRLTCVAKSDGRVLWQHEHHLRRDAPDEAGFWSLEEYVIAYHKLRPLAEEVRQLERKRERLEGLPERQRKPDHERDLTDCVKRLGELQPTIAAGDAELKKLVEAIPVANVSGQLSRGGGHGKPNALTYAIATPASDGRRVYAWLPIGVVACYDLEGNRQWVRVLGNRRATGGWYGGQVMPSPVLVDGKLVVHYDAVYCLDAASGETLWTAPQRLLCLPSPVPGKRNGHTYIALGTMQILRLSDGKYVAGASQTFHHDLPGVGSPVCYGDVVTWLSHALRLPASPDGPAEVVWQLDPDTSEKVARVSREVDEGNPYVFRGAGWHHYSSPLEYRGTLYYHHEKGMFSGLDAATGKLRFSRNLELKQPGKRSAAFGGEVYPGLLMAGEYFFAQGSRGVTAVLKPDAKDGFAVVAENQLDRFGGNMHTFSGRRMFVRVGDTLYAFGE